MNVGFETKNAGGKSGTNEWYTAKTCYTEQDNGLILPWEGEVFLNPPYSRPEVDLFMRRMAEHANLVNNINYSILYCSLYSDQNSDQRIA